MVRLGPVAVSYGKQNIVTKSSTEALSDYAAAGIHLKNFLISQGYDEARCILKEDNMSTMAMVKRGEPAGTWLKHINIRYFWIKDRVDSGEVNGDHTPKEVMVANLLTKPVQG